MAGVIAALFPKRLPHPVGFFGYPLTLHLSAQITSQIPVNSRQKSTTVEAPYKTVKDYADARIAQPSKGKIYDKKPFKVKLIKGKKYAWCCCGWSKSQPFCDGTHSNSLLRIKLMPVIFIAPETNEYWLCNCKQTSQRPFCDGTHREEEIQLKIRS